MVESTIQLENASTSRLWLWEGYIFERTSLGMRELLILSIRGFHISYLFLVTQLALAYIFYLSRYFVSQ